MGAPRARKALRADKKAPPVASAGSDDEEANRDLSLEIVERAKRRVVQASAVGESPADGEELVGAERKRKNRKEEKKRKKKSNVEEVADDLGLKQTHKKKRKKKREKSEENCYVVEDVEFEGSEKRKVEKTSDVGDTGLDEGKKKRNKKRKQRKNGQSPLLCGNVKVVNGEEALLTVRKEEPVGSLDSTVTDLTESFDPDNAILRKLLRIPRYFDAEDTSWKVTCYNCGEEGHHSTKCTAGKRKRPCFLCGEFGHNSKHCSKGLECFVCKQVGHAAKDCTKKKKQGSQNLKICLRCGESGHEMTFCTNDYSPEDLNQIQCYMCGKTGHLCCMNHVDASSVSLSCYNCGQNGHTGFGCAKPRWEVSATDSTTVCHFCGEEGHFSRGCTKRVESAYRKKEVLSLRRKHNSYGGSTVPRWNEDASTPGRILDWDRQFSGSRSAPHEAKAHTKRNVMYDQRTKTARKPRIKNGWTTVDDVGTASNKTHRANGRSSFSTPVHNLDFENRSWDLSSRKKHNFFSNPQRSLVSVHH